MLGHHTKGGSSSHFAVSDEGAVDKDKRGLSTKKSCPFAAMGRGDNGIFVGFG